MRTRHRTPSIFNLSMVDVLCCALGCVILLWLLNLKDAKQRALAVGETTDRLKMAQSTLDLTAANLKNTSAERDALTRRAELAEKERDRLRQELQSATAESATQVKELTALRTDYSSANDRLMKLTKDRTAIQKEKSDATDRLAELSALIRDKDSMAKRTSVRVQDLAERLRDEEARIKKLQADLESYRAKLSVAEAKADKLETESGARMKGLTAAEKNLTQLQMENRTLADQAARARGALENRFEGIALTGQRVVFLIDMSGSMELVDEKTPDANKWPGVRDTLAKIMKSLPDLEKFQVIIFSDKTSFLLGDDSRWINYDPKSSVEQISLKMSAIKPQGATNMHDAFEAAFRFRATGLDTIYVLSDGLPNMGPGLTNEQANNLKEEERSDVLSKFIRKLLKTDWNRPIAGRPRVKINTVGFFYESPDVGAFLWALARENDGSFVGMSKP